MEIQIAILNLAINLVVTRMDIAHQAIVIVITTIIMVILLVQIHSKVLEYF